MRAIFTATVASHLVCSEGLRPRYIRQGDDYEWKGSAEDSPEQPIVVLSEATDAERAFLHKRREETGNGQIFPDDLEQHPADVKAAAAEKAPAEKAPAAKGSTPKKKVPAEAKQGAEAEAGTNR